jgi:hypothetical protein
MSDNGKPYPSFNTYASKNQLHSENVKLRKENKLLKRVITFSFIILLALLSMLSFTSCTSVNHRKAYKREEEKIRKAKRKAVHAKYVPSKEEGNKGVLLAWSGYLSAIIIQSLDPKDKQ